MKISFGDFIRVGWRRVYVSGVSIFMCSATLTFAGVNNDSLNQVSVYEYTSFTANYELRHQPSREIIARYRMTISENGFRFDQQGEGVKSSVILNSQLDKMWLLDRSMKHYHEVPIRVASATVSANSPVEKSGTDERSDYTEALMAGFIQFSPCNGMSPRRLPGTDSESPTMQVWECLIDNKVIEKQWFDREHGVVVRSESFDGMVATITDIQTILLGVEFFQPPSAYRNVALETLMPRNQPLVEYENKNSLLHRSTEPENSLTESAIENNNRYTAN